MHYKVTACVLKNLGKGKDSYWVQNFIFSQYMKGSSHNSQPVRTDSGMPDQTRSATPSYSDALTMKKEWMMLADAPRAVMFAVVTVNRQAIGGGMAPIFYAQDIPERNRTALWLSRITNCIVHDLHDGSLALIVNAPDKSSSSHSS